MGGRLTVNQTASIVGDVSINNRLFVKSDISGNANLYITGDASLNNRLFLASDLSMGGRLTVNQNAMIVGDLSVNNRLYVSGDISGNARLFILGDGNITGNLNNSKNANLTNVIVNGTLTLVNDLTVNTNLYAVTQGNNDNSNHVATTQYVRNYVTYINTSTTPTFNNPTLNIPNITGNCTFTDSAGYINSTGGLTVTPGYNASSPSNFVVTPTNYVQINGGIMIDGSVNILSNIVQITTKSTIINNTLDVSYSSTTTGTALNIYQYGSGTVAQFQTGNSYGIIGNIMVVGLTGVSIGLGSTAITNNYALDVSGVSHFGNDSSFNSRLCVGGDVSLNSYVTINKDLTLNGRLIIAGQGPVSFNVVGTVNSTPSYQF